MTLFEGIPGQAGNDPEGEQVPDGAGGGEDAVENNER